MRGYYGIAIYKPKYEVNVGSLFRTAYLFDASFVAVIGGRYKHQYSDTVRATKHLPFYKYNTFENFACNLPKNCALIGIELTKDAKVLQTVSHPERAVYLFGAEDGGLPTEVLEKCQQVWKLDTTKSLNVASCGSIVLYDRKVKNVK